MSIIVQLGEARSFLKERKVFLYLYYLSIAAVLIGFLYSRALLSIGQISIAAVWLLEGDLREKIRRLKEDKLGVFLAGLYLIHVIWLLNTSNFIYAGEDLRIKLPLLLFPIVFSSTDILDKKSFKYVLYLFVSVILSSTIVISVNYLFHGKEMKDIREASFLISHIRLALMICLSIAVLIYYASKENTLFRIVAVAIVFWFALYMFMFVYLTGIILLSILLLCMLFWFMRKRSINQKIQRGILLVLILSFGFMAVYMLFVTMDYYQANKEKNVVDLEWTANGNPYKQFYKGEGFTIRENGYLVYQNVHFEEVQAAWNNRSANKVTYFDDDYAEIEDVIIRFVASKGLPKDSLTISQLTEKEIQAIESGITNVHYMDKSNSYKRLYNMLWQYDVYISGGNFNGHSLGIRMEFWKTGWHVFKRHLLFGTGTGDIEDAFQEQYDLDQSKLTKQWRFRSHNQIISMAATFGIFGLIYFLLLLFLPAWLNRDKFLYLCFALIFFVSVLTEDTLETQIGVTFYAFFTSLLLFQGRRLTEAKKD